MFVIPKRTQVMTQITDLTWQLPGPTSWWPRWWRKQFRNRKAETHLRKTPPWSRTTCRRRRWGLERAWLLLQRGKGWNGGWVFPAAKISFTNESKWKGWENINHHCLRGHWGFLVLLVSATFLWRSPMQQSLSNLKMKESNIINIQPLCLGAKLALNFMSTVFLAPLEKS